MQKLSFLFILIILSISCQRQPETTIDLSGEWRFEIDRQDIGEDNAWFSKELEDVVYLPGSMVENGKGDKITLETKWTGGIRNPEWFTDPNYAPYHDPENIRFPYWLQPEKKYTGAAWYQKSINISKEWGQKNVILNLERCHWETTVWIDGQRVGTQNSLATPHRYNLGKLSSGKHLISIKVDNRIIDIDPGWNSHSITDHTQTNWNGIVGDLSLSAVNEVYIEKIKLFPDVKNKNIDVNLQVLNSSDTEKDIKIIAEAKGMLPLNNHNPDHQIFEFHLSAGTNKISFKYDLGDDALLWDEFNPNVYDLGLKVENDNETSLYSEKFGLREFNAEDGLIKINGRQVFLRGTLECAIFPKTGYPPTDTAEWKRIFRVIKSHGLNHMRFHSWCPPEAAFKAADEAGVYLQVECSSWANQSSSLGDGNPIDNFIWEESKRLVDEYGNHPSFCMMAYGNEPGGPHYKSFLAKFVDFWKGEDNRRIYTSASGWPIIPENEYHDIPGPRIQAWGEELGSIINAKPPKTDYDWHSENKIPSDGIPVVSHEIGQWCVYPDFKEIDKYTGVLKPKNFEIFQESLKAHHLGYLADSFLMASGKLQALCYKADIEAALRTKNMGGFQLLDLHDFPGQGTALVGVLDPFWEEKGYISPEEYSRFCNAIVPLARLKKRVFLEGENLVVDIEVANFSEKEMQLVQPDWILKDVQGNKVGGGNLEKINIPIGNGIALGKIDFKIPEIDVPKKLVLEVNVDKYSNDWDIWVYPENGDVTKDADVIIVDELDEKTKNALDEGKNVLLSLGKGKVKEGFGGEVGLGFSSIFWNTAWTDGQKPHTLGILCNPKHPALELFPTEYHSNWQWWDALTHADVVKLSDFPVELTPIVRVIDDWITNRNLALLFEAKVGNGKLIVSGVDLKTDLDKRPEARQLLVSLKSYMESQSFNPEVKLTLEDVKKIIR